MTEDRLHPPGRARRPPLVAACLALLVFVSLGAAASTAAPAISLRPMATGLAMPTAVVHAGDGSGRLFITLQDGQIVIHDGTRLLASPFLDIATIVSCCGERGLLGLAFHPNYATNGFFFVHYTDNNGDVIVARYTVSSDPNRAQTTGTIFLTIPHRDFSNHNGGQLAFGPNGYLYIGVGDGGGGGDTANNAQQLTTLLGKILRIDVDSGTPYAIPATNPFVGTLNARTEIWAYGVRNGWRFSFDRLTGDLFLGDVGQNLWEEINFQPASSPGGENYGWRLMEATHCFNPGTNCNDGSLTLPIIEYRHAVVGANPNPDCSVIGGYRYRGAGIPELAGTYVFGDLCSGRVLGGTPSSPMWTTTQILDTPYTISSFGEDQAGELYLLQYDGVLHKIAPATPRAGRLYDFNGDGKGDVLWRHSSGVVYVWLTDGAGGVIDQGSIGSASNDWIIEGVGDFNGDGRDDILWRHGAGLVHIWFLDGLSRIGSTSVRSVGSGWTIEGVGDFNGDSRADILWRYLSGITHIWFMNGASIAQEGSAGSASPEWTIQDVGDFNGDGRTDILWRHALGSTFIWLLNGLALVGSGSPGSASNDWSVQRVDDFNGDGRTDILWRHALGSTAVWLIAGTSNAGTGSPGSMPPEWIIEAAGARPGGGEILWRHPEGQLRRWAITGTSLASQTTLSTVHTDWIVY